MKFLITMNMASNQGKPVHQMTCEVEGASNLKEFHALLHKQDYIVVSEYYIDYETRVAPYIKTNNEGKYNFRGKSIINCAFVGKVRELEDR